MFCSYTVRNDNFPVMLKSLVCNEPPLTRRYYFAETCPRTQKTYYTELPTRNPYKLSFAINQLVPTGRGFFFTRRAQGCFEIVRFYYKGVLSNLGEVTGQDCKQKFPIKLV